MGDDRIAEVFVDATPAEVLDPSSSEYLSFVGAMSSAHLRGFRQYKDTRGRRKAAKAKELTALLTRGEITVAAVGVAARMNGTFIAWAIDAVNEVRPRLGAEWDLDDGRPVALRWRGRRYEMARVLGLAAYAAVLPLIGLRFALVARDSDACHVRLVLDALPFSSSEGMELINAIATLNRDQQEVWAENLKGLGSFEIANPGKYKSSDGEWHPGKTHPGFTLADWLAVGLKARVDPSHFRPTLDADPAEAAGFATIWQAAIAQGSHVVTLDLEDPTLREQLERHRSRRD